jgi:hypothetical protein
MTKPEQNVPVSSGIVADKKPLRPYKKPQLAIYGKLAELTAGVNGSNVDPGHMNNDRRG